MAGFSGFPVEALDFYDDLELDNTKSFWTAHKDVYDRAIREPMLALVGALEKEFGAAKVFRPYRDVRFAKDKTPYKDHQGAFVGAGPSTGLYIEIGSPGVRVAAGFYHPAPERLAAIRAGIAADLTGPALEKLLASMKRRGWELGGERLKTTPRGYAADHPRIDLLRHKTLVMSRSYGFDSVIHTADLLPRVRKDWRAGVPLLEWIGTQGH